MAVLAGRRGEGRPTVWSPLAGAVLLGLGVAGAVVGSQKSSGGEIYIAASSVASVLGMVLLIPLVVSQLGRLARLLPLPARFAVRDAARHRSRTAPAIAAVAATVAGVVALGIGGASDAAQNRATYSPTGPLGAGLVSLYDANGEGDLPWDAVRTAVQAQLPKAHVADITGLPDEYPTGTAGSQTWRSVSVTPVTDAPPSETETIAYSSNFGSTNMVGARTSPRWACSCRPASALARGRCWHEEVLCCSPTRPAT